MPKMFIKYASLTFIGLSIIFLLVFAVFSKVISNNSINKDGTGVLAEGISLASTTYSMADGTSYNLRFDGAAASNNISGVVSADLNNNGKLDLIICSPVADNNSRTDSGSVYVIYDSILDDYTGTNNTINLATNTNYNLRFDGAVADNRIEILTNTAQDIDGNGKLDLIISAPYASFNSRHFSGSFYIIYDTIIDDYPSVGHTIDLNSNTKYNVRYDGPDVDYTIGDTEIQLVDINNNAKLDIAVGTGYSNYQSRSYNGSVWFIYDSLIDDHPGLGQTVDLATDTNFNLRYDGANDDDILSDSGFLLGDLNNNGKVDLLVGATQTDNNSRDRAGSLYIIYDSLIDDYVSISHTIDLATSTNYNIRYDGAEELDLFGEPPENLTDIDGNGKNDLTIGAWNVYSHSRTANGAVYVIYDTLLDDYTSVGHNIDLLTTTNYNIRIDGAVSYDRAGEYGVISGDFNGNGIADLIIPVDENYDYDLNPGRFYVVYDSVLATLPGVSNTLDLATNTNFNMKYNGPGTNDWLGRSIDLEDVNDDGKLDILVTAEGADYNSKSYSGSVYIIYNFPHVITETSVVKVDNNVTYKGNVTVTNSVTKVKGVEYKIGTNSPDGTWTNCSADDGTFNSLNENFTCDITNAPDTAGTHNIYVRAYDDNISLTLLENYLTYQYVSDGPPVIIVDPVPGGDTTAPPKVIITSIGLIGNVPDRDYLSYYFTSQTPGIKGDAEANSTVFFVTGNEIYQTTANQDGHFYIVLYNPMLPREKNTIQYYAKDAANNKSPERTLVLIIGEENFPSHIESSSSVSAISDNSTSSSSSSVSLSSSSSSSNSSAEQTLGQEDVIITVDGVPLTNSQVTIDNKTYTTDENGKVTIPLTTTLVHNITFIKNGITYTNVIRPGDKIVNLTATKSTNIDPSYVILSCITLLILFVIIVIIIYKRKKREQ